MKRARPKTKSSKMRKKAHDKSITRLDGVGRWPETMDHLVWFLRRAGVSPKALDAEFAQCLKRHEDIESLTMPSPEVLEYSRILTRWATDPAYIDEHGKPRALPLTGARGSFASLVKRALPEANAKEVFETFKRYGMIRQTPKGHIEVLSTSFLLNKDKNDAQILAYALQAFLAIMTSARSNLTSTDPRDRWCQFVRLTFGERFDLKYLPQYDAFSRASAQEELARNDQWFQRHECKGSKGEKDQGCVGMGIFVFKVDR